MRLWSVLSILGITIVNMVIAIVIAIHSHFLIGLVSLFVLTSIYLLVVFLIASRTTNQQDAPVVVDEDDLSLD